MPNGRHDSGRRSRTADTCISSDVEGTIALTNTRGGYSSVTHPSEALFTFLMYL